MVTNTKSIKLSNLAEDLLKKGGSRESLEAVEALKRSIRLGTGEDMKSYLQVAASLYESGDYEHAKIFLNIFLEYWMAAEAYFILGAIAKREHRFQDAILFYEKGISLYNGMDLRPYHECLSLCIKLKDDERAFELSKCILKINNKDKEALSYMAKYHTKLGAYKEGMKFYSILVENNIADYNDYHYYGICLHETKDYKKAENMYLKALELYPSDSPETTELKNLRKKNLKENYPDIEESKNKYSNKIKENPDVSSYFHLGNIEFIGGNYDKAAELYNKAKSLYEETTAKV